MAHTFATVGVPAGDATRQTFIDAVSSNYFDTLGVPLAAGRTINLDAMSSLLYDVKPLDPVVFVSAPLCLGIAALVATWLPARRATRLTPLTALRTE